jgi:hypothetical protein
MNDIIEFHGGNDYQITHMNKAGLERENNLPISIPVSADAALCDGDGGAAVYGLTSPNIELI